MSKVIKIKQFPSLATDLDSAIKSFISYCTAKNLSPRTIEFYNGRMTSFQRFIAINAPDTTPENIDTTIIREYLIDSCEKTSASTANHNLNVLRNFLHYLVSERVISYNPALDVDKQKKRKTVIQTLSMEQIQALLSTCKKDFYGTRDRALILMLLDTGIRINELINLKMCNLSIDLQTMVVLGKGDKEREVPFGAGVKSALLSYLVRRGDIENNELVFVNHYGEYLTRFSVRDMLKRRGKAECMAGARLSPHTFRHTFAKQWLLNGGDAFSLQRMLGHTTMDMVKNYVNMLSAEVQSIHRNCSPVDRMRGNDAKARIRLK